MLIRIEVNKFEKKIIPGLPSASFNFVYDIISNDFEVMGKRTNFSKAVIAYSPISGREEEIDKLRSILQISEIYGEIFSHRGRTITINVEPLSLLAFTPVLWNQLGMGTYSVPALRILNPNDFSFISPLLLTLQIEEVHFQLDKHEFKESEKKIEMDFSSTPIQLEIKGGGGKKMECKKIILSTDSQSEKLKNFALDIEYNLKLGNKNITIKKGKGEIVKSQKNPSITWEREVETDFYGITKLKLEHFPELSLKGKLTRPTDPPNKNPSNGNNPDIPQLISQATTNIQTELDRDPKVVDSELGQYSNWRTEIAKLDTKDKIDSFESKLISEIERIRISKESDTDLIRQAINNLTDENQKAQVEEFLLKLITAEYLVKKGKFDQEIYDELNAIVTSNSDVYQILNQGDGRVDKVLFELFQISLEENEPTQPVHKNDNSLSTWTKWMIGGVIILVVAFITAVIIWKIKKKKNIKRV